MMVKYLKVTEKILYIEDKQSALSFNAYLHNILNHHFRTLKTIRKIIGENLNIKRNIPLFLNDDCLLIPLHFSGYQLYLNFMAINKIISEGKTTIILFKDGSLLNLSISRYKSDVMMKNAEKVRDYALIIDE